MAKNNVNSNISDLQKLVVSVEEKRLILQKMYNETHTEPVLRLDETKKQASEILKNVHFDSTDDEQNENKNKLNSTYKLKSSKPSEHTLKHKPPLSEKKNQASKPKTISKPTLKTPTTPTTPTKSLSNLEPKHNQVQIKPRINLSMQQKRKLALECKIKLDKELEILRSKILARKFAHIWIRKYFYSKSKCLLLPSQLE
jgi:hypothetical protein